MAKKERGEGEDERDGDGARKQPPWLKGGRKGKGKRGKGRKK